MDEACDAVCDEADPTPTARLAAIAARIEWWRVWSGLLVFVAVGAIVMLIVEAERATAWREHAAERERHGFEVLIATRAVDASMASAEAALARYTISADRLMGSTYYDQWVLAGAQIGKLQRLVARDGRTARLARRLADRYDMRGRELGLSAQRARDRPGPEALTRYEAAGHAPSIAAIHSLIAAIEQRQRAVLERRTGQSEAVANDASHLVELLSATGVLLILVAGGLGWMLSIVLGSNRRAEAQAEDAASRADWLREAVEAQTAQLRHANAKLHEEMAERAAAEAQVRQMQKMDAVGQLTGGIAHDFNNMLAVVVGSLDLARRRLDAVHADVAGHIDHAMEGADRAAQLTRRLLGFARAEALTPAVVEPGPTIAGMSELLARTLGDRVVVRTRIARNCWPIWVDPAQLENALLNLAVNGRDAMRGAGSLVFTASNIALPADTVRALPAGDYVRIAVGDSGEGMSAEVIDRAFEPFFTTKPVGKGTGLGLSQVFGFTRTSGGDVVIDTAPGRGTTVSLYLPRAVGAPVPVAPPAPVVRLHAPARATAAAGEPILLVEDDARVRAATAEALVELGYAPIACDGAAEALEALERAPTLRLMISDVMMPETTGPELAAMARRLRPELAVLFVTGYSGEDGGGLVGEAVLRKPFTIAALETAVAAALGGEPDAPPAAISEPCRAAAVAAAG